MGIDYYQCFLCKYCGPEGCFQKEVYTPHEEINYCDDCVEQFFIETPMNYWIKDENSVVSKIEYKSLLEKLTDKCKWCCSVENSPPHPDDITSDGTSLYREHIIYLPNQEEWKKRELEVIDQDISSLKRRREAVEQFDEEK
jgi:hypothetical protein